MSFEPEVGSGDNGEYVTLLQERLSEIGHYDGRVDGDFGTVTEEAVRSFQEAIGHERDGRVGTLTWEAMEQQVKTEPAEESKAPEEVQWSEDGKWWWDGTEWHAAEGSAEATPAAAEETVAAEPILSEDGQWQWDGSQWLAVSAEPQGSMLGFAVEVPDEAEELQAKSGSTARSKADAVRLVRSDIEPKECFIEFKGTKEGWGPIDGTGCAHWVAHQRGGPKGTTRVCDLGFKFRVEDLLPTLTEQSTNLSAAAVGDVWKDPVKSHIGIVRTVHRDEKGVVVSVDVENDSSKSGGVVTQNKTAGSIHR